MNTPRLDKALATLTQITEDLNISNPMLNLKEKFITFRDQCFEWPQLTIGDKTARIPVIQGGMGLGISMSSLASAVANAGGIGVIAGNCIGLIEKDYYKDGCAANIRAFRSEIRKARAKTDGLIGVNIMVAVNDFYQLLDVAIEEKVDLVIMGAGLPVKNIPVERMRANGVMAAPIVSSARAAKLIFKMWKKAYKDIPDAVIFEGPKAGGHLGFSVEQLDDPAYQLEAIVPEIVDALKPFEKEFKRKIPVVAAGGVYTGADIHSTLKLGAAGVQMGTRFVATDECDADRRFKEAYVHCTEDQIGLIDSPVGMPGRAIRNAFIEASEEGLRPAFKCAWQCLNSCKADKAKYCISIALNNARKGNFKQGFVFAGSNAFRVEEIVPVAELVKELAEGFKIRAREGITERLERFATRVQELKTQYDGMYEDLGSRIREAGLAYERALKELQAQLADEIAVTRAMLRMETFFLPATT